MEEEKVVTVARVIVHKPATIYLTKEIKSSIFRGIPMN